MAKKLLPAYKPVQIPEGLYALTDMRTVSAAIMSHDKGDFSNSAKLATMSLFDPRIFGAMQTRTLGALCLPLVETGTRPAWIDDVFPVQVLVEMDFWAIYMGFSLVKVDVNTSGGQWIPKSAEVVKPHFIRAWNEGFIVQMADGSQEYVDDSSDGWLIHRPFSNHHPWLMGAIRCIATNFADKYFTNAYWGRRTEIESVGIRIASVPDNADDEATAAFVNKIDNLGYESTLKTPEGFGFKIQGVDSAAYLSFRERMQFLVDGLVVAILGQLGTSSTDSSYATANVLKYVQQDRIKFDLGGLSKTISKLVARVNRWNGTSVSYSMSWDSELPSDTQKKAAIYQTLGQSIDALAKNGASRKAMFDKFGIGYVGDPDSLPISAPAATPAAPIEPDEDDAEEPKEPAGPATEEPS